MSHKPLLRKAEVPWVVIGLVLAVLTLVILLWPLGKSFAGTRVFIDKQTLDQKVRECDIELLKGEQTLCGIYPPKCNVCLGATKSEFQTDDDMDGMPDVCEKEDSKNNPKVTECKYYYRHNLCCKLPRPCESEFSSITCTPERPKE